MYLKKLILVNWGNLPNSEFEFGPLNLFSGGNGSGKTTAADAIQTLMTAAHENLFQFNPGQDETTQRGRGGKKVRTLASYILGCDDGSYARLNPTDGYIVGIFHPTDNEDNAPFAAMLSVRAYVEKSGQHKLAKQDSLQFYIVTNQFENKELSLNHLILDMGNNKSILTIENCYTSLIQQFGNNNVEKYDTKRAYLRRLYGALRGKKDAVSESEALNSAKAFSRFMAYKPVQSIDRFVSEEILEKKDLGEAIRSISGQLKTIHGMERDAARLTASIDILQQSSGYAQNYIDNWSELQFQHYLIAQYEFNTRQKSYLNNKEQQQHCQDQIKQHQQSIDITRDRREQMHEQRVALEAQRLGISALQEKDELAKRIKEQEKQLSRLAQGLLIEDKQLQQSASACEKIMNALRSQSLQQAMPELVSSNALKLTRQFEKFIKQDALDIQALLGKDLMNDIQMLEKQLDAVRELQSEQHQWINFWQFGKNDTQSMMKKVSAKLSRLEMDYERIARERQTKQKEIDKLDQSQVSYPDYVVRAIDAIRNSLPHAEPRVLCDHVEVTDERWQAAIEGYMGGARFSIIVHPEYEADAIRIIRQLPGRASKARIIQGDKAQRDYERLSLDDNSILGVLEFSHATAKHYVAASYGAVLCVEDTEQLKMTRRGVTQNCLASGNYSMWRCDIDESDLVFGIEARKRATLAKQNELSRLTEQWQMANDRMQSLKQLLHLIEPLKHLNVAHVLAQMLSCHRELQKLENLIQQIDLGDHHELEDKLNEFKQKEDELRQNEDQLIKQIGQYEEKLSSLKKAINKIADEQDKTQDTVERCEQSLQKISEDWPDIDFSARLELADQQIKGLDIALAYQQRESFEQQLHTAERKLDESIKAHNQNALPGDSVAYDVFNGEYNQALFRTVCQLQRQMDSIYNRLKNNILVEKHGQLQKLKDSFNNAFVSNLCHSIHQAINDGKRQIKLLNHELKFHKFGDDRETFRFDFEWLPEYKEYSKFFEEIIRNPELGDGQTLFEAKLTKSSQQVRDRLMNMLLDDDEDKALRDLDRIADYRNYHRYEIYKEVEGKPAIPLSEYGTGSGGQLETPAYIIRAAAITSAFRFSEGKSHLRMVLVDEAFSKMDETRSREVIQYLTDSLGLQLVFIMPTSKCGPYMDLITNEFVYAKCPSSVPRGELNTRVLVDRKVCNQDKIQALWQNHRNTIYQQAELDFMQSIVNA
ncbi:ATP-binding protein [Pleionea mediterranea]|uniref:AAA domain-containing protein n=1 Tax=Pleionea mediterranea TaxID=523701 RepID=A0A316FY54_9GAMM|nr:SbcC/MukB-like Walker B domain-containing protein [Pleionea mediterranea]PWK53694.1 AAA domain-containing protein [Pleionea mediterranea]